MRLHGAWDAVHVHMRVCDLPVHAPPPCRLPPPLQVMLRVGDLQRSIAWYRDVLGMQMLRTRDNPEQKYSLGFMGYGPEDSSTVR